MASVITQYCLYMPNENLLQLFALVRYGVLTQTSIALYVYFETFAGKPASLQHIGRDLHLSIPIIVMHTQIMQMIGILRKELQRKGASTYYPLAVTERTVSKILSDSDMIATVSRLRDKKMGRYAPRSYDVEDIESLYKRRAFPVDSVVKSVHRDVSEENPGHSVVKDDSVPLELQQLLKMLPPQHHHFRVTPAHVTRLQSLCEHFNLEHYTKWFMKRKLGVTVRSFSLGIFTYQGILDEYKLYIQKNKFKKTTSGSKERFAAAATKFKEEMQHEV